MKRKFTKAILAAAITAMPLAASEYELETESLFAVEGGASSIDVDVAGPTALTVEDDLVGNIGLKIGAQSEHYRVFLSARYYSVADLDSLYTFGGELQYMFNFSKYANFFVGGNVGKAIMEVTSSGGSGKSLYYGGDAGFNIHAGEHFDIELGARYMHLNDEVTPAGSAYTFKFNSIVTGYASLILKWQMD